MPDRLDRVTIALVHGTVEIPWASRDELLAEIADDPGAAGIVRAFKGAGASAPIKLTNGDKERRRLRYRPMGRACGRA
jgi:hypothetical protein